MTKPETPWSGPSRSVALHGLGLAAAAWTHLLHCAGRPGRVAGTALPRTASSATLLGRRALSRTLQLRTPGHAAALLFQVLSLGVSPHYLH